MYVLSTSKRHYLRQGLYAFDTTASTFLPSFLVEVTYKKAKGGKINPLGPPFIKKEERKEKTPEPSVFKSITYYLRTEHFSL